ncbi:MAG: hypothetical protein CENE_03784 [Candidatus Celerinatantimonas neptuna]|nr:MAG: hypothetical protein CENE_03784 [Candidatus Celerinatantimonas neptuna]
MKAQKQQKRLQPHEMRDVMLKNARVLMSSQFKAPAPEVSGPKRAPVLAKA